MSSVGPRLNTNALINRATVLPVDYGAQPWRIAYMETLFENDRQEIGARIAKAIDLMLRRKNDLHSTCDGIAEMQAINRGLHALRALQTCQAATFRPK